MVLKTSDKLMTIPEAIKLIPDGAQVALGGWVINRCVIALTHEMIRQKKRNLIITQGVGAMDADLLVGAGCVKRYIYAGGSLEPSIGPLSRINEANVNKEIEIESFPYFRRRRLHPVKSCKSCLNLKLKSESIPSGAQRPASNLQPQAQRPSNGAQRHKGSTIWCDHQPRKQTRRSPPASQGPTPGW